MDSQSAQAPRPAVYVIGPDFGTESARAVPMRAGSSEIVASAIHSYGYGVIERHLHGRAMSPAYALQDADDYLAAAEDILRQVGTALPSGASGAGVAVAFTSSTPLPVMRNGQPLSRSFPDGPHA